MKFYRRLQPIKAMSFDLDDTLYDNYPVVRRAEAWMHMHLRSQYPHITHLDNNGWLQLKRHVIHLQPSLVHDVSAIRIACLTTLFLRHGYSDAEANSVAQGIFAQVLAVRSDFVVPEQTFAVLSALASKIPLIAVTNGNVDTDKIGLTPFFTAVIKPGNGLRMKPYPDLFSLAAKTLEVPPQHILHVGDHLNSDVAGAIRNGFMSAWFNDQQQSLMTSSKASHLPDIEITHLDELTSLL
ncbi:MAG: 5-amino-6-(5-phospho-D-ribitylamino)uracil phosphatase YigB [Moritella sp.]|uniref:5-amino-6-(5-phospho-D-ribitylamino)uracil phosphatase YigB n=1 Tax=Moritella sp. TaxID=78556 RepID=UPI0029A545ED|nr:5-amino-6-(5-phospho-D-ribitylamino)uracil phosphatase YigB [Moritella sp.]MDX2320658.1 5-amino-6-(5-phospho-D-ribitylamino)uracil phosphatase YigB [Moritella sp.]